MKFGCLCAAVLSAAIALAGCGALDYDKMLHTHKAMSMMEDGVWEKRYEEDTEYPATDEMKIVISVNVKKDMSEDDMLEIMDYLELQNNASFDDAGIYVGESDMDYTCYAVFYRGDTDEEIKRIKYVNGESVAIGEEDEGCFAGPELRDVHDEESE